MRNAAFAKLRRRIFGGYSQTQLELHWLWEKVLPPFDHIFGQHCRVELIASTHDGFTTVYNASKLLFSSEIPLH